MIDRRDLRAARDARARASSSRTARSSASGPSERASLRRARATRRRSRGGRLRLAPGDAEVLRAAARVAARWCSRTRRGTRWSWGARSARPIAAVPAYNLGLFFGYRMPARSTTASRSGAARGRAASRTRFGSTARESDSATSRSTATTCPRRARGTARSRSTRTSRRTSSSTRNYRAKYPLGTFLPVQDFPPDLVERARHSRELAGKLGIDAGGARARRWRASTASPRRASTTTSAAARIPWAAMMTGRPDAQEPQPRSARQAAVLRPALRVASVGINAAGLAPTSTPRCARARSANRGPVRRRQHRRAAGHRRRLPERPVEPARNGRRLPAPALHAAQRSLRREGRAWIWFKKKKPLGHRGRRRRARQRRRGHDRRACRSTKAAPRSRSSRSPRSWAARRRSREASSGFRTTITWPRQASPTRAPRPWPTCGD